ncbi:MAG: hypothetical protein ACLVJB_03045 [Christensenellales bacterium]
MSSNRMAALALAALMACMPMEAFAEATPSEAEATQTPDAAETPENTETPEETPTAGSGRRYLLPRSAAPVETRLPGRKGRTGSPGDGHGPSWQMARIRPVR